MQTIQPSRLLKWALLIDAAGSGALAIVHLGLADKLPGWTQLPAPLLWESGLFMVAYVAFLIALVRSPRIWPALVNLVVWGNVAWAAACVALLLFGTTTPSAVGMGLLLMHALGVLLFAALEFAGLKASSRTGASTLQSAAKLTA